MGKTKKWENGRMGNQEASAAAAGEQDTGSQWDKLSVEAAVLDGVDGGSVPLDFLVGRLCIDSWATAHVVLSF